MKTYQYIWRMWRYRPWLYLANCVLWSLIHAFPLVPGLIACSFFDRLTGGGDIWWPIAWLAGAALARVVVTLAGGWADTIHRFSMSALLRKNMLERVLEMPGAAALREAPGEAISRFRDDTQVVEDFISWCLDTLGTFLFAVTAFVILLDINARITAFVFLPLVGVVAAARWASARVEQYRVAAREATSRVTGAIGEVFGSVQAIQLAGA
jgi:ATP-binding cassette subfamily B protein